MRGAYAIMSPLGQSHTFEERKVKVGPEEDALKIGRAVARLKPGPDNAIFDCKVLSRNHAVLYYSTSDNAFYLKDTKSSNGTFVNNDRLSPTGEESEPRQVYSGDIFQFGVEIVENSSKESSVAHGCIFAVVKLFDDSGREVVAPALSTTKPTVKNEVDSYYGYSLIGSHQLFQLQQYLKEALFREKAREEKIRQLEEVLSATDAASETAWKAGVNEDRLLARIESLEATLAIHAKHATTDKLKAELEKMVEERSIVETTARDNLKRSLEERNEAVLRLADAERSMVATEEECNRLRKKVQALEDSLCAAMESSEKQLLLSINASKQLVETEKRAEEAEFRLNKLENSQPKEESTDDKVRAALLHLACSPPVDKALLSSLHAVTSLMLKEGSDEEEEEVTEAQPPVVPLEPHASKVEAIVPDPENRPPPYWKLTEQELKDDIEDLKAEKAVLIAELEEARNVRKRREKEETVERKGDMEGEGEEEKRERKTTIIHPILTHLPSVIVLSMVPWLGLVLLLLFPLLSRFT